MAQGMEEALRFSQVYHSGTARFSAMGGAFAALGGDATTLTYNPAGLGVYRSSEFTFTPHLLHTATDASYMGNVGNDDKFKFGVSNLAGIGVYKVNSESLKYLNFGISYNKTNHFSAASMLRGKEFTEWRSLADYFAARANDYGVETKNTEAWLGWEGYAIDYDTIDGNYVAPYKDGERIRNEQHSTVTGDMGEYAFSIGGNISDIFYFGVTLGVVEVEYDKTTTISETSDIRNQKFDYSQYFNMTGSGFNFKFGFVVTPLANADFGSGLRIGAAMHTPTFLSMTDRYYARVGTARTDENEFEYGIQTPTKYMAGLAYVFPGNELRGIVSIDYEYTDYSQIKMREARNYAFDNITDIQSDIKGGFNGVSNIRVGGELGYKQLSLRAGYAHYGNPYTNTIYTTATKRDGAVQMLSGGIGIRIGKITSLDFTYTRATQSNNDYLYYYDDGLRSDEAKYDVVQNNFLLTLGWRF
ncbi:hemin receptor [Bacteroidia bacterium]|nr:hemin receptor [Bacteroidia bacterium]